MWRPRRSASTPPKRGQRIGQAIEAHGGLAAGTANGPLAFRFNYRPLDDGTPRDTYEVASYWSAQTRHRLVQDITVQYGWDGQQAWVYPTDTLIPYDVRFWSLTPYYFVGIPFVLADEGINLALLESDTLAGKPYDLVKVTYEDGVGDAPDDYYVIYVGPDDNRVDAIRYIVSYPGYFPDGGHAPEKLMTYQGAQTVDGITLPERYRTFWWKDKQRGKHITTSPCPKWPFAPTLVPTTLPFRRRPYASRIFKPSVHEFFRSSPGAHPHTGRSSNKVLQPTATAALSGRAQLSGGAPHLVSPTPRCGSRSPGCGA